MEGGSHHIPFRNTMPEVYIVKVEEGRPATDDGKPSVGPVYRSIYAEDGLLELPSDYQSPWDFFRESTKRNPNNKMLGRHQKTESQGAEKTNPSQV